MSKQIIILIAAGLVFLSSGCGKEEGADVFTGPAVRAAREAARDVEPGTMQLTAFSAYDTGDLTGLEGRSFIVKLPVDAPPNTRLYFTHQWYVAGKAKKRAKYSPLWRDRYVEKTRCWLVDIAFQRNLFAEGPSRQVLLSARFKSLDESKAWFTMAGTKLAPPPEYTPSPDHHFVFWSAPDRNVKTGQDVPLGVWFVWSDEANFVEPMKIAKAAPVACVFFVRFQTDDPEDASDRTTESDGTSD